MKNNTTYFFAGRPAVRIAAANGIKAITFYRRIDTLGWTVKDACTVPTRTYLKYDQLLNSIRLEDTP